METTTRARHLFTLILATVGVLSICWLGSATSSAQSGTAATSVAVESGPETFQESCAVCHGAKGRGNGPAAAALIPRPSDLSTLAKRNGGVFPTAHVEAVLKSTDNSVEGHTSAMMIWRAMFLADANGNSTAADTRVSNLVKFIASLQVK
jgi:hypothetical protein